MANLIKTIEVTKEYVKLFNAHNLMGMASLLDPTEVVFTRQSQPTLVGKQAVMNRTHKLFERHKAQGQHLIMINAIIDLPDMKAYPCMLGVLDGEKFSVCFLSLANNGLINTIAILLNPESLEKARATQPDELEAALKYEKEPTREELEACALGLEEKEKKLKRRIKKDGNTPVLMGKMLRLETAKKKLAFKMKKHA